MGRKKEKEPRFTEFYDLLGCSPDVEPKELRAAYLRRSRSLHPDKGGDKDEFQRMKSAYDVLSDPSKRKLYDRYGPNIIAIMEGNASTNDVALLAMLRTRDRLMIVAIFTFVSLVLIIFPVLISIRWNAEEDGKQPYSWAVPFIPVWFLMANFLLGFSTQFKQQPLNVSSPDVDEEAKMVWKENEQAMNVVRAIVYISVGLALLLQIFLVLQLDGVIQWSWYAVLAPWYVFHLFVMSFRTSRAADYYRQMDEEMQNYETEERRKRLPLAKLLCKPDFYVSSFLSIKWSMVLFLTSVLVAFTAEHNEGAQSDEDRISFFFAACPFLFLSAYKLLVGVLAFCCKTKDLPERETDFEAIGTESNAGPTEEDERPPESLISVVCQWIFTYGLLLVAVTCTAAKLTDIDAVNAFAIFSPFFFIVGCTCCLFSLSAMTISAEDFEEEEGQMNGQESQRQEHGTETEANSDNYGTLNVA